MERSGKREGLLEKTAEVFDLPGDVVAGLPRIELTGSRELRMENHKGILSYGGEEIHISGGKLVVKVRGSGLELRSMRPPACASPSPGREAARPGRWGTRCCVPWCRRNSPACPFFWAGSGGAMPCWWGWPCP